MHDAQRAEIAKLETLHAEHPQGRIFTHLAEAYRKAGELDRAREVLAEGIGRHPDYSSAHVVLGRVLADQGDDDGAATEFRRVLELDSHNLVALRSLGDLARRGGRSDEALDYYGRLLDVEPSDEDVRGIMDELRDGVDAAPAATEPPAGPADYPEEEGAPWTLPTGEQPAAEEPLLEDLSLEEPRVEEPTVEELSAAAPDADEGEPWVTGGEGDELAGIPGLSWSVDDTEDAEDAPGAAPPETGEPGVMTETIAQVYARQGLYAQAAEVYRELIRARPGDEGLRTRLEEMEALAQREGGESGSAEVEPLPGLESGELGATPEVEPLAGLESNELDGSGLRAESFEPSAADAPHIPEESVDDVPPPPEEVTPWDAPSVEEPDQEGASTGSGEGGEPWATGSQEADEEPWSTGVEESWDEPWMEGSVDPEPDPEAEAERVESVWTGAEGASGAQDSPYEWADPSEEESSDTSEPVGRYLSELLSWQGGPRASEATPAEAAGEPAAEPATDQVEAAPPTTGPEGTDAGEDDDLDTFRSWLESLKE